MPDYIFDTHMQKIESASDADSLVTSKASPTIWDPTERQPNGPFRLTRQEANRRRKLVLTPGFDNYVYTVVLKADYFGIGRGPGAIRTAWTLSVYTTWRIVGATFHQQCSTGYRLRKYS
jgi:hypothetical protein